MKHSIFFKFWFLYVLLGLVYLVLISGSGTLNFFRPISAFIGLFVPFGFGNTLYAFSSPAGLGIFALILFLIVLFALDRAVEKRGIYGLRRFLLNLAVLFVFTIVADFCIWGSYASLNILLNGGYVL